MLKHMSIAILLGVLLATLPGMAMEQYWTDDLNTRFPNLGQEFQYVIQQKLSQYGETFTVETLIEKCETHPEYSQEAITNITTFGIHSDLTVLYPAVGRYEEALHEAKLLRDFVLAYPPEDPQVVVTFRGVYTELLIVNGQYEEALQECEETLALAPDEEGIFLSRGVAYTHLHRLDEAVEELKTLIKKPDPKNYAQQLFEFVMTKRHTFQEARVQRNTMIDVMLRELEPQHRAQVKIPTSISVESSSEADISHSSSKSEIAHTDIGPPPPLNTLLHLNPKQLIKKLGQPLAESDGETTIDREYVYNGRTLTITFDKQTQCLVSLQLFFLPPVDETEAFALIGLPGQNPPSTIMTESLKVWSPYEDFSKVQLVLHEQKVMAVIIQP